MQVFLTLQVRPTYLNVAYETSGQTLSFICAQFCREIWGEGQSGQAIKLFQITPYVNDFQTLNNPDS